MDIQKHFINKIVSFILIFWTFLLAIIGLYLITYEYKEAENTAIKEAVVSVKKDLAYRSWVAFHGGVYVPITKDTPPNPYLAHIKNRDVNTTANQQLTLMNPAYTLSQMMKQYSALYGIKGHITSKKLTNPKNKPDTWESKALDKVEVTKKAFKEISDIDGEKYYRYLNPLVVKQPCLKCHEFQDYKVGDIRGGVSVSIPMNKLYEKAFNHSIKIFLIIFILWSLGVFTIFYGRKIALKELNKKIRDYEQHIYSLVDMIEKRDSYTAGHTQRVAEYCVLIATEMDYSKNDIDDIYRAGMLHDIGKISTPDSILLKPGRLTSLEFEIIKEHVVTSYEILKNVDIYKNIAEIVKYHHEKYDGTGYPYGLKGDAIPMMSHIMILADAFDAMTTNRIYKARKVINIALEEVEKLSAIQFHPAVVEAALIALKNIEINDNISQRPKTKLERERFSYFYKDIVTGVYNRDYLEYVLVYNHEQKFNLDCVYSIYLHNFTKYNKKYGWSSGDIMLKKFAKELENMDENNLVFRVYGDDFIILNKGHFELEKHLQKLEDVLKGSEIAFSYKHFDIEKGSVKNLHDLEQLID